MVNLPVDQTTLVNSLIAGLVLYGCWNWFEKDRNGQKMKKRRRK